MSHRSQVFAESSRPIGPQARTGEGTLEIIVSGDIMLTLITTLVLLSVHHYFYDASRILRRRSTSGEETQVRAVYAQRLWGVFWLALVPIALGGARIQPRVLNLGILDWRPVLFLILSTVLIFIPIIYANSRQSTLWLTYPEIRSLSWNRRRHGLNALSWAGYLIAYEFLFRGYLLFGLAAYLEDWLAITIMTVIYVGAHYEKPRLEMLGCIPVGIVFGYVALASGGIWGPVIAHILIAVSNDEFCQRQRLKSHPPALAS